ncbi:response regulator [Spirosoma spitsbergense]|jgi:CheY-like chemotaxis protein|uniref:response regulator n=1 Tax=Spirosoma spitsbergense TaxID=431554 RepID=UPI000380FA21|nr:response regulator [Spirosoma spitsbergense]
MTPCTSSFCNVPTYSSVWIVDDDEDDWLFICSAFQRMKKPIQVRILSDGDQLVPQLATCTALPRLILLDINMSRQNGFETLEQVRSMPIFAHLPVVMFTTSSDAAERQRSLALGANQYLTKPGRYDQLIALAEDLTERWALV